MHLFQLFICKEQLQFYSYIANSNLEQYQLAMHCALVIKTYSALVEYRYIRINTCIFMNP